MALSKQALRSLVRQQKAAMPPYLIAQKSQALCHLVLQSELYCRSQTIYGYLPFNQEVQILPLLQQAIADGKQVALPKCHGREMRFILISDLSLVQRSPLGVPEPVEDAPIAQCKDALVLVPGVVFDRRGYRIGYGGGYYDQFLAREPDHPTIALCYDFQLVHHLPAEPHDIPVDVVFSV